VSKVKHSPLNFNTLPPEAAQKLVKICGLFGSNQLGERASAALRADELVKSNDLTWCDVIGSEPDLEPHTLVRFCLDHAELLTAWEASFVSSCSSFRVLSAKQLGVLARISAKIESTSPTRSSNRPQR
jgi:hypothetical protein